MPKSAYPNTQSAAYAMRDWINDGHRLAKRLTARPWNFYEPTNTDWWLIPSTEWPAYRHAKLFFRAREANRVLYTGFYVEKGLSPRVAAAYPTGKKLIMQSDWTWHVFFEQLAGAGVTSTITSLATHSESSVRIELFAHLVEDPGSYDPYAPPMDYSRVAFDTWGDSLTLVDSVLQGKMFAQVVESKTLSALTQALAYFPDADWTWVNLSLGIRLEMAPLVLDGHSLPADAWDASAIWEKCLQPWKPWIL